MKFVKIISAAAIAAALVSAPLAASAEGFEAQIKARQGQMQLIAMNLGVLAGMARGKMDYDADMAQTAADDLVALSSLSPTLAFPEGSAEGSASAESIWTNNADFIEKWDALNPAAIALASVASTDAASIGAALGGVGATCGSCHKAHRVEQ